MIIQRLFLLLCLLLSMLVVMVLLAIDDTAKQSTRAQLTPVQIAKAKLLFDRNDPRRVRAGSITTATLGEEELNLGLNYAVNQSINGGASLKIEQGKAYIAFTLPLPNNPVGRFLNLQIELAQTTALPEISGMRLGSLPIPNFLAHSLINYSLSVMPVAMDWRQLTQMVKRIRFVPQRLIVTYQWRPDLATKLGVALSSSNERDQLILYQTRLAELTRKGTGALALTDLLQPLFQLASERSQNGDAIQENRAVIRVLAFYVNQKDLGKLFPGFKSLTKPLWRTVTLQKRDDFTKHYLVSAFLAADAGSPLADAMGLYKEIQDSKGGSGFSFNDIAADRAGTRMGELAIAGEQSAKNTQSVLKTAIETDIMPKTADLPEFMSETEFNRRYGGLQGYAYLQMIAEIERRVAALAINPP